MPPAKLAFEQNILLRIPLNIEATFPNSPTDDRRRKNKSYIYAGAVLATKLANKSLHQRYANAAIVAHATVGWLKH